MTEEEKIEFLRAYLFEDIIRLGFSPSNSKEKSTWLFIYSRNLIKFWEDGNVQDPPKSSGDCFSATISSSLKIDYEYAINVNRKFSVKVMCVANNLLWTHDFDNTFFIFPNQRFLTKVNERNQLVKQMKDSDIKAILDSLIFHPTPHQHLESPIDEHKIRIGGGLTNPFLYLFNFRFQLCPSDKMRKAEKTRLIELFRQAIINNKKISANDLMKVPAI